MVVDIVVCLQRNIQPDIICTFLIIIERITQVLLNIFDNLSCTFEVPFIPILVAIIFHLLTMRSMLEEGVEEIDGENLNLIHVLELTNTDMLTLCDVEEHSVEEE